jgi:hypothetical protein
MGELVRRSGSSKPGRFDNPKEQKTVEVRKARLPRRGIGDL